MKILPINKYDFTDMESLITDYNGNYLKDVIEVSYNDLEQIGKNNKKMFDDSLKMVINNPDYYIKQNELELETLRQMRENECFKVINRGTVWYDRLTSTQKQELNLWYLKWLNVTMTKEIPIKPTWLK